MIFVLLGVIILSMVESMFLLEFTISNSTLKVITESQSLNLYTCYVTILTIVQFLFISYFSGRK